MSNKHLLSVLFGNAPFFDGNTQGLQGVPIRHIFMTATIHKMAQSRNDLKLLEVGSWTGNSVLTWSQAIDKFCSGAGSILCVDPWTPYLATEDVEIGGVYQNMNASSVLDLTYDLFLHNIQFVTPGVKIDHFRGRGLDVLPYLAPASFDVVYLDGSHYLEDVRFDLTQADILLKDGGILCGDDLELQGDECDLTFAKKHPKTDYVVDPKSGKNFHPGVTVAVYEMFSKVSSFSGYWLMQKENGQYQPVNLDNHEVFVPSHFPPSLREELLKAMNKE